MTFSAFYRLQATSYSVQYKLCTSYGRALFATTYKLQSIGMLGLQAAVALGSCWLGVGRSGDGMGRA